MGSCILHLPCVVNKSMNFLSGSSSANNKSRLLHSHHYSQIHRLPLSRRSIAILLLTPPTTWWWGLSPADATVEPAPPNKPSLPTISNTKSWDQFVGNGFAVRVPPGFEDIMEPEDYTAGLSLYGDRAKPKTFAARFASPDRSETLSVVIRPSNQLKITFLEAKDITDLGSLKDAARIFVPGGATLQFARTIKIKEEESLRTYYFYEFNAGEQHVALFVSVNNGKAYIAGATSPESKWVEDGIKLRSAVISLTIL